MENLTDQILSTLIFAGIGIILMVIGYKVIDFIIPADLNKEIEKGNISAGLVAAGVFISVAIIVSAVIR